MIDFSSVKEITIPEGSVNSIQIGGVTVWSSVPSAPTISISDSGGDKITITITLNPNNDPVKYRVTEYAPDGTKFEGSWGSVTSSGDQSFDVYSYSKSVTVEAYSYRDTLISDTVSQNYTLSRSPYLNPPTIELSTGGIGTVHCTISCDYEDSTIHYHYSIYSSSGGLFDAGEDEGTGVIDLDFDLYSMGLTGGGTVSFEAYCKEYGITSNTVSDSITI